MERTLFNTMLHTRTTLLIMSAVCLVLISHSAVAQSTPVTRKVWTIAEVLDARQFRTIAKRPKYCQGGLFKPCVCPKDVPSIVQYRPAIAECGGKAGIVLSGKYKDVFSVVVRDRENKDRWPTTGINGCTAYERDVLALNKCSAFKMQKMIEVEDSRGDASVHCLGASGYSTLFKRVVRMTAKLADIPNSTADPLARWCLKGPVEPLN
ncbi:MAG: hypothetical protein ACK5GN_04785 [Pseudomonadota bacterium]|jgi:hypothetical protein